MSSRTLATVGALVSLVVLLVAPLSGEPAGDARKSLAGLSWLAGSWKGPKGSGEFGAYYSTPEGGKVLSYSELRRGGKVVFHEFEKFDVQGDTLALTTFPGGKPRPGFRLTELDAAARKAVFEFPENDFPTRLVYHRVADERLVITASDPHHGSDKKDVYDLKRIP